MLSLPRLGHRYAWYYLRYKPQNLLSPVPPHIHRDNGSTPGEYRCPKKNGIRSKVLNERGKSGNSNNILEIDVNLVKGEFFEVINVRILCVITRVVRNIQNLSMMVSLALGAGKCHAIV